MDKKKLLITGATGNVGHSILNTINIDLFDVTVAVRNIDKAQNKLNRSDINYIEFDIENGIGFNSLPKYDYLFLMRPPQIADVAMYFKPLIDIISKSNIKVIFLSVQGADKMSYIPHSKIEKIILNNDIPYVFVRPSYFMSNLITTLYDEIKSCNRIFIPSGKLKFNWIDVDDLGLAISKIFEKFDDHKNSSIELTNNKNQNFYEIVDVINKTCGTEIFYKSPNLIHFIAVMIRKKYSIGYIGILLLLHFLPRFGKEPNITKSLELIIGKSPNSIEHFVTKNKNMF